MNKIISGLLVVLSIAAFGGAGYIGWSANLISEDLQIVTSQARIYGVSKPDYSVFTHNFDDKAKFGDFNAKINKLLPKTHVNNVNFAELGKYQNVLYNKALYNVEAEEGYLQFIKFMGYIHDSKIVHRVNDLSIKSDSKGKINLKVNFEVLGYVKENS